MKHKIALPSIERLCDTNDLCIYYETANWLKTQPNINTAWKTCLRGDWMISILYKNNQVTPRLKLAIQLLALEIPLSDGRRVLDLITDKRSLAFVDMKRRKLNGKSFSYDDWKTVGYAAHLAYVNANDILSVSTAMIPNHWTPFHKSISNASEIEKDTIRVAGCNAAITSATYAASMDVNSAIPPATDSAAWASWYADTPKAWESWNASKHISWRFIANEIRKLIEIIEA